MYMEKNKVIFLDRDGVINYDYGYVHKKEELEFIPGVIESLKALDEAGYKLIIITNQSGIGRGYFTLDEYLSFNQYMVEKLEKEKIKITGIYYCPHTDKDKCGCRKPKVGLFKIAIKEHNVDLENSYAIGDNERDLAICSVTSIKGILINKSNEKYICKRNLKEATDFILSN